MRTALGFRLGRLLVVAASLPASVAAAPGQARDAGPEEARACIAAAESAQAARIEGRLREAREAFRGCAQTRCPQVVARDCQTWLEAVERELPSIVLSVQDDDGQDVVDASVKLDGAVLALRLDGRPIAVDPGAHTIEIEASGSRPTVVKVLARIGERNRSVTVRLSSSAASAPLPPSRSPMQSATTSTGTRVVQAATTGRALVLGLGAVAVASFGSFAYFGLSGRANVADLRASCAPDCAADRVGQARTRLVLADVSLSLGIGASVAAVWLALRGREARVPLALSFAGDRGAVAWTRRF